ncbi:uncharacterized protein PHALS_14897 [Plasmopara halstedii]|uniref:Uncharacterized protein n=1 Tax=Plasmopara halstedii TaxID=4781 RepID=A0A0P1AVJ0_PLAHL|nr:uncharacterized protein PHALS_14897 [Plasmopara halstedii]CEG46434.1 hypothetical protein PHALS_14897 [Plasmopara halstedii]|eukprot:XP_024582803.1 hypothetical protein PHALS_14897 [Plasmopara halstedii]
MLQRLVQHTSIFKRQVTISGLVIAMQSHLQQYSPPYSSRVWEVGYGQQCLTLVLEKNYQTIYTLVQVHSAVLVSTLS